MNSQWANGERRSWRMPVVQLCTLSPTSFLVATLSPTLVRRRTFSFTCAPRVGCVWYVFLLFRFAAGYNMTCSDSHHFPSLNTVTTFVVSTVFQMVSPPLLIPLNCRFFDLWLYARVISLDSPPRTSTTRTGAIHQDEKSYSGQFYQENDYEMVLCPLAIM